MTRSQLPFCFISMLGMITIFAAAGMSAAEPETPPVTAAEATAHLFGALAGDDIDDALAMTAPVKDEIPEEPIREHYRNMIAFMEQAGTPRIIAQLQLGDTAVVIFREGGRGKEDRIDLDPAYLVRRDGRWLVLFRLTRFDRPYLDLSDAELARFGKLEQWYNAQKPILRELLKDSS